MISDRALPLGWTWAPLASIAEIQGGIQKQPTRAPKDNAFPFLRVANVLRGRLELDDVHRIELLPGELERLRLMPGDLLVVEGNGSKSEIGRVAIWNGAIADCVHQNHLIRVRPGFELSSAFAAGYLNSPEGISQLVERASSTSGLHTLSVSKLKSVYIPLAPRTEQDRIVAAIEQHLSDIDAGVAALKRILANLKRYRASVLKAACEGRLVPTEAELARKEGRDYEPADVLLRRMLQERRERWEADQLAKMKAKGQVPRDERWKAKYEEPKGLEASELPELPEGWVWAGLGQLTSLITSGSRGWGDRYAAVGPLFIRAQDIKTDRLVLENVARVDLSGAEEGTRTRVRMGDLLVTITGANVTKTASVVMDLEEAYVSQHVGLVRPLLPESAAFLHAWIVSPAQGRRQLERVAYGAGKPGLNLDNLRELSIALPPLPEQHRIVAEVDRLLSVADETEHAVRAQLARAERLRQAVLKNAFEGKLVPQDPQDEPASVLLERIRSGHAAAEPATSGSAKTSRKGRAKVLRQAVKGEMNDG